MPQDQTGELREFAGRLLKASARLAGTLHPITRTNVAELVRHMNSYYSNLIEGHHTHPADIERALKNDYSKDPAKRALQLESAAHVEVERAMDARSGASADLEVCTGDFIRWLHLEFYRRMPEEFLLVPGTDIRIEPGQFRTREVTVGAHLAPAAKSLPEFLERFSAYASKNFDPLDRLIASAAAHHRLAWIHPFQDGNGRVSRLFSHAHLNRAGLETGGLWAISRGFARQRDNYRTMLASADAPRQSDIDGRGNLSNRGLVMFCTFFLRTALDQVEFMSALLDLDMMQDRIMRFAAHWATLHDAPDELGPLLRETFLRGAISRGDAAKVLLMPERTARRHLGALTDAGLLVSSAPGAPLSLAFSSASVGYLFPRLYPEGVEI